jgi:hypothetical protein
MILKHIPGKQCSLRSGCGRIKPLTDFRRNAKTPDGYDYICRDCTITRPRKPILCRNEKASQAGWIVAFCECPVCMARRRRKAHGKGEQPLSIANK